MPERRGGGGRVNLMLLLTAAAATLLGPGEAGAQTTPADVVAEVHVVGNSTVDSDLVLRGFGVSVGSRYAIDSVRRGIRRLYDLGFFADVIVEAERGEAGVVLTLRVSENPRVAAVELSGNKKVKEKDLLEATGPIKGKMADDKLLANVERAMARLYQEKGYTRAEVRPRYLPGDSESRRILLVEIDEGPKMRVQDIRFVGLTRLRKGDLKGPMKQGTTGFLKGGVYQPEVVKADMKIVEETLAKHGFRDGKVLGYDILPGDKEDRVIIEIRVEEGPRYYIGAVKWEGNKAMPTPALYGLTKVKPGSVFNAERIEQTIQEAYGAYADLGYIYLSVRDDYAASDSTLDVTFLVTEGEPSRIHDVIITGNTRTKERVIRRQLTVRPGDIFRRNALIRSQRELQQLGYFSNMNVDYKPVAGSTDIDLTLDVEERQVGTASAGFGFSSSVGLTGFMELGHSNLFGNGQRLNLRVERGSQRNNAEISFTEPWLFGTPTTAGIDLFTTNRRFRGPTTDLEVRRTGGAVRLGRPLPLAYTRFLTTYRFERQKIIDEFQGGDIPATITTGFRLNQETTLSSSLTLALTRNSTNHPIYPTLGSKSLLRIEWSGGPLGGDQVFQKYELDWARYLSTFKAGGWGPTFMFRTRAGAVGELFRDSPLIPATYQVEDELEDAVWDTLTAIIGPGMTVPVPRHYREFPAESYELFRMGGTTFDPLRGYDDFEIVPRDNVARQFFVSEVNDSTYNVTSLNSFYPGGRYMLAFTGELQFVIAEPLHGLLFADFGGTWNEVADFRWDSFHKSVGIGARIEIPLLGLVGFDYAYGFDRLDRFTGRYDRKGWEPHLQFGRIF